jgi:alpha-L-rhamnosidase
MKAFVDTNATNDPSHIWPANHGFGDWCPPVYGDGVNGGLGSPGIGNCTSEVSLVNTALSYLQAVDVAKAATALGYPADAAHFTALAQDIKDAFNATFLNASHDGYADGRQVTSILPLAFGMVPADDVTAVGNKLVSTIVDADNGHLDTGIFGTRYLVDALASIGRIDVAMTVLDETSYPGFGYEIDQGATTDWEQWTYRSNMESHDHAMFSGINASLYTKLAGITPTDPGYATVAIAPQVPPTLNHVSASIDTVRGAVASTWTKQSGWFDLTATVPVNASATVAVPLFGGPASRIHADHGATLVRIVGDTAIYAVGSGAWQFRTPLS